MEKQLFSEGQTNPNRRLEESSVMMTATFCRRKHYHITEGQEPKLESISFVFI